MVSDKPSASERAISIVRSRYHESDLSAATVSRAVGMSERHFSCYSNESDNTYMIGIHQTYYGPPPQVVYHTGFVECDYTNLACSSGTPKCTSGAGGSFTMGGCPAYLRVDWLVVNGSCIFSLPHEVGGPGPCN